MFKLFVVIMLCVIALHACAADTVVYAVHLPVVDRDYIAVVNSADVTTFNTPFQLTDSYWRIW